MRAASRRSTDPSGARWPGGYPAPMGMRPQDLQRLMQQAQQMQAQLQSAQAELATQEFRGSAGGGVVTATVLGSGKVVSVEISPSVIDPDDPEMLGDLVTAAVNAAIDTASAAAESQMGGLTDGLDLGGLLG